MDRRSIDRLQQKIINKIQKEEAKVPKTLLFSFPLLSTSQLQEKLKKAQYEINQMFFAWEGDKYIKECEEIGAKAMIKKYGYGNIVRSFDIAEYELEALVIEQADKLSERFILNIKNEREMYENALKYLFRRLNEMYKICADFKKAIEKFKEIE